MWNWKCLLCKTEASSENGSLEKHMHEFHLHPKGYFVCNGKARSCLRKKLTKYISFTTHVITVHRNPHFKCSTYKSQRDSLERSRKSTGSRGWIACILCGEKYLNWTFLQHANKCHRDSSGFYKCTAEKCSAKIKTIAGFRYHLKYGCFYKLKINEPNGKAHLKIANDLDYNLSINPNIKNHDHVLEESNDSTFSNSSEETSVTTDSDFIEDPDTSINPSRSESLELNHQNHIEDCVNFNVQRSRSLKSNQKLKGQTIYQCCHCEISFSNETWIVNHVKNRHNESVVLDLSKMKILIPILRKSCVCSLCGAVCINEPNLKRHFLSYHSQHTVTLLNLTSIEKSLIENDTFQ